MTAMLTAPAIEKHQARLTDLTGPTGSAVAETLEWATELTHVRKIVVPANFYYSLCTELNVHNPWTQIVVDGVLVTTQGPAKDGREDQVRLHIGRDLSAVIFDHLTPEGLNDDQAELYRALRRAGQSVDAAHRLAQAS